MKKSSFQISSLLAILLLGSLLFFACDKQENVLQEKNTQIDLTTQEASERSEAEFHFIYDETDGTGSGTEEEEWCLYEITHVITSNHSFAVGDVLCLPCTPGAWDCPIALGSSAIITDALGNPIHVKVNGHSIRCKTCPSGGKKLRWG